MKALKLTDQSAYFFGIIFLVFYALHKNPYYYCYYYFMRRSFALVAQAGVQWCDLGSLQPPHPGSKRFPYFCPLVAGIMCMNHHAQILCILIIDRVSPCWAGWSWTPDLRWFTHIGLPKCWDYRCELLRPVEICFFFKKNLRDSVILLLLYISGSLFSLLYALHEYIIYPFVNKGYLRYLQYVQEFFSGVYLDWNWWVIEYIWSTLALLDDACFLKWLC